MAGSQRLSARATEAIADGANEVLVSAASAYEIEFKRTRDADLAALPPDLEAVMRALDFTWLPIQHGHAIAAGCLPRVTGDPFDRLIVARPSVNERSW
jgi:PIN domain nuclease of toxin-antitoxin system